MLAHVADGSEKLIEALSLPAEMSFRSGRGRTLERVLTAAAQLFGKGRLSVPYDEWDDDFHDKAVETVFCGTDAPARDAEMLWRKLVAGKRHRMREEAREAGKERIEYLPSSEPGDAVSPEEALGAVRQLGQETGAAAMLVALGNGVALEDVLVRKTKAHVVQGTGIILDEDASMTEAEVIAELERLLERV